MNGEISHKRILCLPDSSTASFGGSKRREKERVKRKKKKER
jgi:hypothetical protein